MYENNKLHSSNVSEFPAELEYGYKNYAEYFFLLLSEQKFWMVSSVQGKPQPRKKNGGVIQDVVS